MAGTLRVKRFNDGSGAQPFGQYVTHIFPIAGTFTATVNVSVNGGAPTPISVPVVVSGSSGGGPGPGGGGCPAMNPADPFVTYSGPVSHCATGTPCQTNETIQFDINTFQYPIACGTHEFTWDFNDGGTLNVLLSDGRRLFAYHDRNGHKGLSFHCVNVRSHRGPARGLALHCGAGDSDPCVPSRWDSSASHSASPPNFPGQSVDQA